MRIEDVYLIVFSIVKHSYCLPAFLSYKKSPTFHRSDFETQTRHTFNHSPYHTQDTAIMNLDEAMEAARIQAERNQAALAKRKAKNANPLRPTPKRAPQQPQQPPQQRAGPASFIPAPAQALSAPRAAPMASAFGSSSILPAYQQPAASLLSAIANTEDDEMQGMLSPTERQFS